MPHLAWVARDQSSVRVMVVDNKRVVCHFPLQTIGCLSDIFFTVKGPAVSEQRT